MKDKLSCHELIVVLLHVYGHALDEVGRDGGTRLGDGLGHVRDADERRLARTVEAQNGNANTSRKVGVEVVGVVDGGDSNVDVLAALYKGVIGDNSRSERVGVNHNLGDETGGRVGEVVAVDGRSPGAPAGGDFTIDELGNSLRLGAIDLLNTLVEVPDAGDTASERASASMNAKLTSNHWKSPH